MGKVRILNSSGDTMKEVVREAPGDPGGHREQITEAEARRMVAEHVAQGGLAYERKPGGKPEQVRSFDPQAEETVLSPRMQGGS